MKLSDLSEFGLSRKHILIGLSGSGIGIRTGHAMILESPDFSGDWYARYLPGHTWETAEAFRLEGMTNAKGASFPYTSELSGPNGAHFFLWKLANQGISIANGPLHPRDGKVILEGDEFHDERKGTNEAAVVEFVIP